MRRPTGRAAWGSLAVAASAALGVVSLARPASRAPTAPFASVLAEPLRATATLDAFGTSREVRVRFALPQSEVQLPLAVAGDSAALSYEWVRADDSSAVGDPQPVGGASFVAPATPGFYRLAITRGTERQIVAEPTLAVMVPFSQRVHGVLNGYKIGSYLADRLLGHDHPAGFVEVRPENVSLRVSTHLRLGDFITHDAQANVWPKYVALNPRLLDKVELVLAKIGSRARFYNADADSQDVAFDVHSGFRTPAHNGRVPRAAQDSRHQYGDAADLAIDADGDGRVTLTDELIVAHAVDQVEQEHPDLVGGLGLYTSRRYRTPYVHIDARGKRSRWKG